MVHSASSDRRHGSRYLVVGKAVITTLGPSGASGQECAAELVNVGSGGMLAFCDVPLGLGERVEVRFTVEGYPLEVKVQGRIVHTAVGLIGIGFLEEPESLDEVLLWLEAGFLACLL